MSSEGLPTDDLFMFMPTKSEYLIMLIRTSIASALVALLLLAGCSTKRQDNDTADEGTTSRAANVAGVLSVTTREGKVPNFSWKDGSGRVVDFDSYRGDVALINFWATWCGPCKREIPDLVAISREMAPRNVKIIGISTDRGSNVLDEVSSFVAENGIPYQIVISNEDLESAFGNIRAIPTSFLIDRNGNIAQTIVGARPKAVFLQAITALQQN